MEPPFSESDPTLRAFRQAMRNDVDSAVEIVLKNYDCAIFCEFLDILSESPLQLSSMLVVFELALKTFLPELYLVHYVYTCIECCSSHKNKQLQQRGVRLLSVFVAKLLRFQLFTDQTLIGHVQKLCANFPYIPEAKQLVEELKADLT